MERATTDVIAVLNAGSSSLKFSLFRAGGSELELEARGQIEGMHTAPRLVARRPDGAKLAEDAWPAGTKLDHETALRHLVDFLEGELAHVRVTAVGHRVAHGGPEHRGPVRLDEAVLARLERLVPLAPLHQPHALAAARAVSAARPGLPQVACFDTSFHRTMPDVAQRFALPAELHEAGVRRYGFHGLSYEYVASALPGIDAKASAGKTVVLHLGNGSSMCALDRGRSVATTMGFTGVEGLPMGTRSGSLDPGVLLYLMDERGMGAREIERLIYKESGLLGLSGISSDMRTLLASSDPRARLAVDVYCDRIGRELGSLAAALSGLDALVFTGGIGENAAAIRERVCRGAAWLGVELDTAANARNGPRISAAGSRVAAWTIPTDEELVIARHTRRLLREGVPR
jgi:acetate kinase